MLFRTGITINPCVDDCGSHCLGFFVRYCYQLDEFARYIGHYQHILVPLLAFLSHGKEICVHADKRAVQRCPRLKGLFVPFEMSGTFAC